MRNVKLIAADLDGTLLAADKSISNYTINVLEECRRRGLMIALATARSERIAVKVVSPFVPDFIISSGGAKISHGGKTLSAALIPAQTVLGVIAMCRQFTGGSGEITVETDSGQYWDYRQVPNDPAVGNMFFYSDFSHFDQPAYKVTAELESEEQCRQIIQRFPQLDYIGYRNENWKRFALRGADKISCIKRVCGYLHISLSDAMAFGDDYNDIEMLKQCGIGVAMRNASDDVKIIADYIAQSNNDDGVAKFLEENILKY